MPIFLRIMEVVQTQKVKTSVIARSHPVFARCGWYQPAR